MKKILAVSCFVAVISSCHYGVSEAKKTLDTNEKYKTDKADYSTNRGNDGVQPEHTASATEAAPAPAEAPAHADSAAHSH